MEKMTNNFFLKNQIQMNILKPKPSKKRKIENNTDDKKNNDDDISKSSQVNLKPNGNRTKCQKQMKMMIQKQKKVRLICNVHETKRKLMTVASNIIHDLHFNEKVIIMCNSKTCKFHCFEKYKPENITEQNLNKIDIYKPSVQSSAN